MRYEGKIYRPPSEHDAYILQATIGCSWNHCTYCDMYRDKTYRVRDANETLTDLRRVGVVAGDQIRKLFVADGDALAMTVEQWRDVLTNAATSLPLLKRVSCYATARNILEKGPEAMKTLAELGLTRLYIGPESGDDITLKSIAKGATFAEHVEAAAMAKAAGMEMSVIALLGAGGVERSQAHAEGTARLVSKMDPDFFAALTLTVVPGTPQHTLQQRGKFVLPDQKGLLTELRTMVAGAAPTDAMFRTNHASNYLPLAGRIPRDTARIVAVIDQAIKGNIPLRPEHSRGL